MKCPESSTPWFVKGDPLPPRLEQLCLQKSKRVIKRTALGSYIPWEEHPDKDAVWNDAFEIAYNCALQGRSESEAIRFFHTRSRRLAHNRRKSILSDSVFSFTDYQMQRIRSIYAKAADSFPGRPDMQAKAREQMVDNETAMMQDAWRAYHANVVSFDQPSSIDDDSVSMAEVIADGPWRGKDSEVRSFLDQIVDDAGLSDEHRLIASIWFHESDPEPQREVMQRFNELTGNTRSLGWINSRIQDIKEVVEQWGVAHKGLQA